MAKKEIEQFDDEIDLREIILAIWNRKEFLIVISTLFAAIALGYAILTKTYSNTISFNQKYNLDDIDFVTLTKSPIEKTSNSKTLLKALMGAIVGFIFGLFIIFIQNTIKRD